MVRNLKTYRRRDRHANLGFTLIDNLPWQNFDEGVRIVDDNEPKTTFTKLTAVPVPDVYRVEFKAQGNPNGGEKGALRL